MQIIMIRLGTNAEIKVYKNPVCNKVYDIGAITTRR